MIAHLGDMSFHRTICAILEHLMARACRPVPGHGQGVRQSPPHALVVSSRLQTLVMNYQGRMIGAQDVCRVHLRIRGVALSNTGTLCTSREGDRTSSAWQNPRQYMTTSLDCARECVCWVVKVSFDFNRGLMVVRYMMKKERRIEHAGVRRMCIMTV